MPFPSRCWTTLIALVTVSKCGELFAQGFPDILYELKDGSTLVDDCFCDHLPIEVPIRGTMVLQRQAVPFLGEYYTVKELSFKSVAEDPAGQRGYEVSGTGAYSRTASEPDQNSLGLDVTINGTTGIQVSAVLADAQGKFPGIDIQIAEGRDPVRDPSHIYGIHLVAAPVSESLRYEVVEGSFEPYQGSFFYDDCNFCGRVTIPLPVTGSFLLRHALTSLQNPTQEYAVEHLRMRTTREGFDYAIAGSGVYTQGGEVALLQSLELTVDVNEQVGVVLKSGKVGVPEGVSLPEIQIHLEQENPESPAHVFKLDLFARPATSPPPQEFRRGDANADGSGDISDAVFILIWRFSGGPAPSCLDAADTNGDALHDLTDAVFLLLHLFQGGPEPPAPGLTACGSPKQSVFGCESYACE